MTTKRLKIPTSFRVIGVGHGVEEIINEVNYFGFEGVSAEAVKSISDCKPADGDNLAIIVFNDSDKASNRVARLFHDAGVMTIGFSEAADPSCFDSIMLCDDRDKLSEIIKTLLQPIFTPGFVSYDFNDLSATLRDTGYFTIKYTSGNDVKEATENLRILLKNFNRVENLSLHLYFNPNRAIPIMMSDILCFCELMSVFPEPVKTIWSAHHDEMLENDIRLCAILSGKEVRKCSVD